ncbi:hypothetical protein [Halocatena halophila]
MVAVDKGFHSQGIGTQLIGSGIETCLGRNATVLCAMGWNTNGAVKMKV